MVALSLSLSLCRLPADGSVSYDITDYLEQNQHILRITDTQDSQFSVCIQLLPLITLSPSSVVFFFTVAMTTVNSECSPFHLPSSSSSSPSSSSPSIQARNMLDHELAMRLRRLCDRDNWMLCQNLTLFVSVFISSSLPHSLLFHTPITHTQFLLPDHHHW